MPIRSIHQIWALRVLRHPPKCSQLWPAHHQDCVTPKAVPKHLEDNCAIGSSYVIGEECEPQKPLPAACMRGAVIAPAEAKMEYSCPEFWADQEHEGTHGRFRRPRVCVCVYSSQQTTFSQAQIPYPQHLHLSEEVRGFVLSLGSVNTLVERHKWARCSFHLFLCPQKV